jgi:hypothetical protein
VAAELTTRERRQRRLIERLEAERDLLRDEIRRQMRYRENLARDRRRLEERCDFLYHEAVALGGKLVEERIGHGSMSKERIDRFGIPDAVNAAGMAPRNEVEDLLRLIEDEAAVVAKGRR